MMKGSIFVFPTPVQDLIPSVHAKGGLGLVSMHERVRLIGGQLAIESQAADGGRESACVFRYPDGMTQSVN